jgi:hypothetical protein
LECEDPQGEMGEEGRVVLAANDRHQDLVDGRKQQRVDYQPSLTEERGGEVPRMVALLISAAKARCSYPASELKLSS